MLICKEIRRSTREAITTYVYLIMYNNNNNNAIQQHLLKYVKITRISCILRPATFWKKKKSTQKESYNIQ